MYTSAVKRGVRLEREPGFDQNLTTLNVVTLGAAQQTRRTFSPARPSSSSLRNISTPVQVVFVVSDTNDLDFFTNLDNAALDTTGHHSTATGDREHVFDWHQERLSTHARLGM